MERVIHKKIKAVSARFKEYTNLKQRIRKQLKSPIPALYASKLTSIIVNYKKIGPYLRLHATIKAQTNTNTKV